MFYKGVIIAYIIHNNIHNLIRDFVGLNNYYCN